MPRNLTTDFVKVATSGPTTDGRVLDPQELVEMAEAYDPNEFTANLWYEHIRFFGNFGKVQALKAEEDDKGRMCLFARLAPTDQLLYLNNQGQKLFTSIEIAPNFADSGKAYLVGLAVTDSPASLGTTELHFSRRQAEENYFSQPIELTDLTLSDSQTLLSRFLNAFTNVSNPESSDAMDEKQFTQLMDGLKTTHEKVAALEQKFASLKPAASAPEQEGETTPEPVSPEQFAELKSQLAALEQQFTRAPSKPGTPSTPPAATEPVSVEQFNQLEKNIAVLTQKFNAALATETPGTTVPEGTGTVDNDLI